MTKSYGHIPFFLRFCNGAIRLLSRLIFYPESVWFQILSGKKKYPEQTINSGRRLTAAGLGLLSSAIVTTGIIGALTGEINLKPLRFPDWRLFVLVLFWIFVVSRSIGLLNNLCESFIHLRNHRPFRAWLATCKLALRSPFQLFILVDSFILFYLIPVVLANRFSLHLSVSSEVPHIRFASVGWTVLMVLFLLYVTKPPTVLMLGRSHPDTIELFKVQQSALADERAVCLLRLPEEGTGYFELLLLFCACFRVRANQSWLNVVRNLSTLVPVIVIDARHYSGPVIDEVHATARPETAYKLLFFSPHTPVMELKTPIGQLVRESYKTGDYGTLSPSTLGNAVNLGLLLRSMLDGKIKLPSQEIPMQECIRDWYKYQRERSLQENTEKIVERNTARYRRGFVGRNDPCPCGSEKKYKQCCGVQRATKSTE